MSVNILYCEGYPGSYDERLLLSLLSGTACRPVPAGGKENISIGVRMIRAARRTSSQGIFALRDRDFDREAAVPTGKTRSWIISDRGESIDLGWTWERREIENYLLDPYVVEKTLPAGRLDIALYHQALENAANRLEFYTAARIAISISRRSERLKNTFSPFGTADDCRQKIREILAEYQANAPQERIVLECFDALLPECQVGGLRRSHFTTFFAGKDLLAQLNPFLKRSGWSSQRIFIEEIFEGLKNTTENIWEWLPEWADLRRQILTKTL
jgi:hypothetical protein